LKLTCVSAIPDGIMTFRNEIIIGSKKAKGRVTLMFAGNMDSSEKLELFLLEKVKNRDVLKTRRSFHLFSKPTKIHG